MKAIGRWQSVFVSALALAVSVSLVTPIGAQDKRDPGNQAAEASLLAQRAATAEWVLAAKEQARGEGFDASIRAGLMSRMETLSMEQLAGLAQQGADADIPLALGSVTSDLVYTPVTPCRVFDSRVSEGGPGPIPANTQRNVLVAGTLNFPAQGGFLGGCGVPVGATSAIINFVTVTPAGPGNIRAWAVTPGGMQLPAPLAAVINYGVVTGLAAIANGVAVPLCNPAAGACSSDLRLQADNSATDLLGDVVGYFRNPQGLGPVPGTIATTGAFQGLVGSIAVNNIAYVFAGPSTSVTVAAGQRLTGAAEAPLGATMANTYADIGLCYSVGAGALTNFVASGYSTTGVPNVGFSNIAAAASTVPGAGTFNVGMCVRNYGPGVINNNHFVNGWVMVTNP